MATQFTQFRVGYTEYFSEDYREFQHDVMTVNARSAIEALNAVHALLKAQNRHAVVGNIAEPILATAIIVPDGE